MLRLDMLGGFAAFDESGASLTIPRHRWALLALVAAAGERGVSRDRVLAHLWPEVPDAKGRARLQQMLHAIRQSLHPQVFLPGDPLRLNDAVISNDVAEFHAAADARDFERAVSLYHGPFLDGFHLGGSQEFDEWLESERRKLAGKRASTLEQLAVAAASRGDYVVAARWWRELAIADPLNSRIAGELMAALSASGDRAGALHHASTHAALVRSEIGVEPDATLVALANRLSDELALALGDTQRAPREVQASRALPSSQSEHDVAWGLATKPIRDASDVMEKPGRSPRWVTAVTARWTLAAVTVAVIGVAAGLWVRRERTSVTNTIAIAPFDVFDPSLDLWRNGLVDILSRNFDGAGPLRATAASVAIARWKGRADLASARMLASDVGARYIVFGSLLPSGPDSARARASLFDARSGVVVGEVEHREAVDRMDRVADSLSARLLRRLNERRSLGLPRMASLGSGNPTAIKSFLKAAQFSRSERRMDSAVVYSTRAIEADSGFALAYLSRAYTRWSLSLGPMDSNVADDFFRAASFNRGLSARDSLLIQTDSLIAALSLGGLPRSHAARLVAVAELAARYYPDDPQVLFALGETWYHFGSWYRIVETRERAVNAFKRAVASDSSFVEAYYHLAWLLVDANDTAQLLTTIDGLSRHRPIDPELALTRQILRGGRIDETLADSFVRLRNVPDPGLVLKVLADTGELGLQLLRRRYESRAVLPMSPRDSSLAVWHLAAALLRRGHWRAAISLPLTIGRQLVEPASLDVAPEDTARALLQRVVTHPPERRVAMTLTWLARRRDTLSIDSILHDITLNPPASNDTRALSQVLFFTAIAPGFRSLAAGDTAAAVRMLDAIPDSQCLFPACPDVYLERVRLARLQQRYRDAYAMSQYLPQFDIYGVGIAYALERAHAAAALGKRGEAIQAYQHVLDAFKHADPEFRKYTDDAAAGLRRIKLAPVH